MIISVDGTIGSGKTTLTSLLALHFNGVDFKYSPSTHEEKPSKVVDFISTYYEQRDSLKKLIQVHDKKGYVSNIMLLHNLIRNMLIRSGEHDSEYVFIDSFWDPFWHFESKYYDEYFPVIHKCVPLPDISLFLDVSAERSIRRASMRDPKTKYTADANSIEKKMNAFKIWANTNIPNFYLIQANISTPEVLRQAITIIERNIEEIPKG